MTVGEPPKHPTAERTHEKAGRKNAGGGEQLARAVAARKERRGKIDRSEGVGVEIVPLDEIT